MSTSSSLQFPSRPSIILTGLPSDHPAVPEHLRVQVAKMLGDIAPTMAEAKINYKFVATSPEAGINNLLDELRNSHVDGLVIGMGVRGNPELTYFMEQIINGVIEVQPNIKIMFNTLPTNTIDAVKRWFKVDQ